MSGCIDRMAGKDIQLRSGIVAILALLMGVFGCKKEPPQEPDAQVLPPPAETLDAATPPDAAVPEDALAETGTDGGEEADGAAEAPDGDGEAGDDTSGGFSAIGKAPRGHDIGLSRDAASNRARKELLELLRKKGVELPGGKLPEGVTIEKFWVKGKFVYAEARYRPNAQALNQPPAPPSKSAADGPPDAKGSPQEGTGP
ncbi:MAG: hypothetical protein GYA21_04945 [Myxococcales bacterium]|nr:hypothetical protein [Myxococcales bacterium]